MNRRFFLMAMVLLSLFACQATTPDGISLLKVEPTPDQGGLPAGASASKTETFTQLVKLGPDTEASVEVRIDVVEDAKGGKYVKKVEVLSSNNGGGELSAVFPSGAKPSNMGTPEAVLTMVTVMVSWSGREGCTRQFRQTKVDVRADGTVTTQ